MWNRNLRATHSSYTLKDYALWCEISPRKESNYQRAERVYLLTGHEGRNSSWPSERKRVEGPTPSFTYTVQPDADEFYALIEIG